VAGALGVGGGAIKGGMAVGGAKKGMVVPNAGVVIGGSG